MTPRAVFLSECRLANGSRSTGRAKVLAGPLQQTKREVQVEREEEGEEVAEEQKVVREGKERQRRIRPELETQRDKDATFMLLLQQMWSRIMCTNHSV